MAEKKVIVLDSGHGGKDPGAVNGSKMEKTAALAIAKKVGVKLKEKGYSVKYTRTGDTYPTLAERCNLANNANADCFVSIHLNSAENRKAEGIETWRYATVGSTTKKLAENVHSSLIGVSGAVDRGVKTSTAFFVLKKTKMPALICEVGFISNSEESKKLFTSAYQDKISDGIVKGVIKTFS